MTPLDTGTRSVRGAVPMRSVGSSYRGRLPDYLPFPAPQAASGGLRGDTDGGDAAAFDLETNACPDETLMWTTVGGALPGSEKTGKTVPLPDESCGAEGTDGRCG